MERLNKVKSVKHKKRYKPPDGFEEIALAWVRDEVTITQITTALNIPHGATVYSMLSLTLKETLTTIKIKRYEY